MLEYLLMPRILDHKSDVVFFGETNSFLDIIGSTDVDRVTNVISQLARKRSGRIWIARLVLEVGAHKIGRLYNAFRKVVVGTIILVRGGLSTEAKLTVLPGDPISASNCYKQSHYRYRHGRRMQQALWR